MMPERISEDGHKKVIHMLTQLCLPDFIVTSYYSATGYNYTLHHNSKQRDVFRIISIEYAAFVYIPRLLNYDMVMYKCDNVYGHIQDLYGEFISQKRFSNTIKTEKLCQRTEESEENPSQVKKENTQEESVTG